MNERIGAVVTGGDFQALGAIRTLARKDIPLVVLDSDRCISKYSRFVKKCLKAPSLAGGKKSYVDFLINLAQQHYAAIESDVTTANLTLNFSAFTG